MATPTYQQNSLKVVMLGEANVGKTALISRLTNSQFSGNTRPTMGAAFSTRTLTTKNGQTVKLELWDTAGSERFQALSSMYYRKARAAILVFDVTNLESFESIGKWIRRVNEQADANILIVLVANKIDMEENNREVNLSDAQNYAGEKGIKIIETSAKTGENVQELFSFVAEKLMDDNTKSSYNDIIQIDAEPSPNKCSSTCTL